MPGPSTGESSGRTMAEAAKVSSSTGDDHRQYTGLPDCNISSSVPTLERATIGPSADARRVVVDPGETIRVGATLSGTSTSPQGLCSGGGGVAVHLPIAGLHASTTLVAERLLKSKSGVLCPSRVMAWEGKGGEVGMDCSHEAPGRCKDRACRDSQKHKVRFAQSINGVHQCSQERPRTTDADRCNWVTRKFSMC